jgi:hypothetical protein
MGPLPEVAGRKKVPKTQEKTKEKLDFLRFLLYKASNGVSVFADTHNATDGQAGDHSIRVRPVVQTERRMLWPVRMN